VTPDGTKAGRSGRRRSSLPLRLFPLLLLAWGGCALFEPRGSERPDHGVDVDWRPPISPDAVLQNLATAVGALEQNLYPELLADSGWARPFQFVADPAGAGGATAWGLEEELACWQRLCDHYDAAQILPALALARTDSLTSGDSASYTATYRLDFPAAPSLEAASYAGTLRLSLSRNLRTGDWAIHRWEDWGGDSLSSWTQLKQVFLWP
jgi:hypothetical protein